MRTPRKPEHRVELVQVGGARAQFFSADAHHFGDFGDFGVGMGQEFVQGRVEQPDRHRQPVHDLEQFGEIPPLDRQQFGQRGAPARFGVGEDHFAHRDNAFALEEHMLGAAKPDALGAEAARHARVGGGLRVGAHFHASALRRPSPSAWRIRR